MKKQKILLLSLMPLILASCDHQIDTSSNNDSSSISSSSPKELLETNYENIKEALINAQRGNFELVYSLNDSNLRDYYANDYVLFSSSKSGYILLDSYEKDAGKILYFFSVDDEGKVTIHDVYPTGNSKEPYITSVSIFNLLSGIRASTLKEKDFTTTSNNTLKSTNANLLEGFSNLLELEETYSNGYIDGIEFYFNDDNNLVFTLSQPAATPSSYKASLTARTAVLENIGEASSKEVEDAKSKFSISETQISEDALAPLASKNFEGNAKVYLNVDGTESQIGTYTLKYNETSVEISSTIDDVKEFIHYEKDSNGGIIQAGLSPENKKITQTISGYKWSQLAFGYNTAAVEPEAFRKTSDNTYHYYGYYAASIGGGLSYLSFGNNASSVDLHLTDGVVSSVTLKTPQVGQDTYGRRTYYRVEIDVASNPSAPWDLSPLTTSDPVIKKAIDGITQDGVSYKAKSHISENNLSYAETIVTSDTILIKEMLIGEDTETVYSYDGYHVLSDGRVQYFTIDENNNVTADKAPVDGDTLMNHCGFACSPAVFELSADGKTFKPIAAATGFGPFLTAGFFSSFAVDDTLVFNLDDQGRLASFSYDYKLPANLSRQKETVEFTYDNVSIDADLMEKINALTAAGEPTNWLEEKNTPNDGSTTKLCEKLTSFYGEDTVKTIPFVYDAKISGEWYVDTTTDYNGSETIVTSVTIYTGANVDEEYWTSYVNKLKTKLIDEGYTLSSKSYVKGNVKITFGTLLQGISFDKI